jgi:hypothetical protein
MKITLLCGLGVYLHLQEYTRHSRPTTECSIQSTPSGTRKKEETEYGKRTSPIRHHVSFDFRPNVAPIAPFMLFGRLIQQLLFRLGSLHNDDIHCASRSHKLCSTFVACIQG